MRRLAWFAGGFGIACLLSCYFTAHLWMAAAAAVFLSVSTVLWLFSRPRKGQHPALLYARRRITYHFARRSAVFCLGAVLAVLWFMGYSALFYEPAQTLVDTKQPISGTVISYPAQTSIGGYSVTVRLDGDFRAPDALVYGNADWGTLEPGDHITCTARLKSADVLYGDETTYYTAKGVFLLGYCSDPPEVDRPDSVPFGCWPTLCAHALKSGIHAAFDDIAAPLATAVTLGDKSALPDTLYSALNRSGVMHAAVVSGMHISFLVSALLLLCRGKRWIAFCLVPFLFFYAFMAGASPSALRAVIMQAVVLAGPILNRDPDPPTSLGLALFLLLIQNPFAAASVSLQLSFASVAGILLITRPIFDAMWAPVKRLWKGKPNLRKFLSPLWRFFASTVSVSLGAMLFTTPLIALYFGQVITVSPLTNLLVLWAVTALMVSALIIGTLAIFFPAVMVYFGMVFGLFGHYVRWVVQAIGRWPAASLDSHDPYVVIWLVAAYLFVLLIIFAKRKWRQVAFSVICLAFLLLGSISLNALSVRRDDLTILALDVGQGASTLFLSENHSLLVDCGGNANRSAGDLAADRLAALGRTKLDTVVFTHLDSDHFNGAAQLFARLEIGQVYLPLLSTQPEQVAQLLALSEEEGAEVIFVSEQQTLPLGKSEVTLFPPLGSGTSNEEGLFVLVSCGEFDTLITGDADAFVERLLVKYYPIPDLEVLMVGHHGSSGSTSAELLDALRPELAIISVGYNSYGHPTPQTLARLRDAGAEVYRTDHSGTITLSLRDGLVGKRESSQ